MMMNPPGSGTVTSILDHIDERDDASVTTVEPRGTSSSAVNANSRAPLRRLQP
jgi:hypothetical protein